MATISTLSISAVLLGLAALPPLARAADIHCPGAHQGSPLSTVTLFDGPPSEHADLEPDSFSKTKQGTRSEWDVAYIFKTGRQLFVACEYGPKADAVLLQPGPGTYQCEFLAETSGKVSLTCKTR